MRHAELYSPAIGASGNVLVYGHYGRPVLVFPAEGGSAHDWDGQGVVHALGDLLEAGRCKLYCIDAFDSGDRGAYESWVIDQVAPFIHDDQGGHQDILTTGCSMGAFHAVNFVLRRADLFTAAISMSGNYEFGITGEVGTCTATTSTGSARARASCSSAARACGRTPRARSRAPSTSPGCCSEKGIPHELDLWGHDVPHDWPSWRAQITHHLPRFC